MRGIVLFIIAIAVFGCANVSTPSGGPEDHTPPKLISSTPTTGQTQFKGQTILLTFDEWVTTQNIESDLIITPRITGSFRARVKKNEVELYFFEPFKDNTTYSISFGKTIKDITNNNPVDNLNISFSTGDYIDSLSISGNIKYLYTQEPMENALVSLFPSSDTTNILNGVASYFALTDSTGNYTFNNLPSGKYRIYATNDKNNNNKADSKNERYGFFPDTLNLQSPLENINFTVQNLNTSDLRRLSARHYASYFDITFSKPITDFRIENDDNFYYQPQGPEKIRFYRYEQNFNDTIPLIYTAKDSLNNTLRDTVKLYFTQSKLEKTAFSVNTVPEKPNVVKGTQLTLAFSKPILELRADSLILQLDSTRTIPLNSQDFQFNPYKTELYTNLTLSDYMSNTNPELKFAAGKGSFISIDQDTSKQYTQTFKFIPESELASISGQVLTNKPNIIVQLLNATTLKILKQSYNKNYSFTQLPPGRYMIRVIEDVNGNGLFDIGNLLTNTPPEPVHFYYDNYYQTKVIEVRKNWATTDTNINF
ncbi:Ig-like domain-containing protein [Roseivirga sp. UBA1976]|uniref:Ig-like domain-containing protein n=1 Tax=Roseivirga sp. UBA1976 TaxID=1947386 RepID=UPI00257FDE04|nr:Ig-like domain-containing protein [Roseivirga sp. UBA1976]MEC7755293.1 Ig-like domain-containing protein [Bacteroidota bacterium]|tara:strand:- start:7725 stop:9335 length:1611 start_codon:yes stop_codon:yes gene_type:complete